MSNFMKIRQVGAELFHADSNVTVRRTDMARLIVGIRNFANVPKTPNKVYNRKYDPLSLSEVEIR